MAPSRTSTVKNKHASKRSANGSGISNSKYSTRPQNDGVSKKAPPKTGKGTNKPRIKKKRVYTEKELGIPALNMITPIGVEKPKTGKKGKVFIDDRESMLTILAMVHADKDGQIESKMMKARQMEEIREARKVEQEKRMEMRKAKLDETKDSMRKKRKRDKAGGDEMESVEKTTRPGMRPLKVKKSVSFA